MENRGKYQRKMTKLCDWPFETKVKIVCDSVFRKQLLHNIVLHCHNQPFTKPIYQLRVFTWEKCENSRSVTSHEIIKNVELSCQNLKLL